MRVFVGKAFRKWAGSESISDEDLCVAAREAFDGNVEADFGGYVFKKRIARSGGGKSGGFRTIIGFRKSSRSNITRREKDALSINAKALIEANDKQVETLKAKGSIAELDCKA